jgi:phosphonate degradation associated HDIG domain protein
MIGTETAESIIQLYKEKGKTNYAGEEITQLEHASQAAQLAEKDGTGDEVIVAAFLHDIGHLLDDDSMDGYGVKNHENLGAEYLLKCGFTEKVVALVRSHVEAKRYLCFANKRYYNNLSSASKATLEFQGGVMSAEEAFCFEKNPLKNLIIKMRTWDEAAKEKNVPLIDFDVFQKRMERCIQ